MCQENFFAGYAQGNIVILAENATQITAGEKNSAGAIGSADAGLFPEVQRSSCCEKAVRAAAVAAVSKRAVCVTVMGTKSTVGHKLRQPLVRIELGCIV